MRLNLFSLLLIREMGTSFEWGEVSSYTLTWAFIRRQRLALTSHLGYGNATHGVCFPSVVCLCVLFNVLLFSAHLSFAFIAYSFWPWSRYFVGITYVRGVSTVMLH